MAKLVPNEEDTKLSDVIRRILTEKDLTVGYLSELTGVKTSTFRNWIQRNKFPRESLEIIAQEIGIQGNLEDIESKYKFDWIDAPQVIETPYYINDKFISTVEDIRNDKIEFSKSVKNLFSFMEAGDEFYYLSFTELPIEIDGNTKHGLRGDLREIIAKSNLNGVSFTYIFPNSKALESIKILEIPSFYNEEAWEYHFQLFLKEVDLIQSFLKKEDLSLKNKEDSDAKIKIWLSDASCFMMPFHKIAFYKHKGRDFAFSVCDSDNGDPSHNVLKSTPTQIISKYIDVERKKSAQSTDDNK
jgi:hypothetical protein